MKFEDLTPDAAHASLGELKIEDWKLEIGRHETSTGNAWFPAIVNLQFPILDSSVIGLRAKPALGTTERFDPSVVPGGTLRMSFNDVPALTCWAILGRPGRDSRSEPLTPVSNAPHTLRSRAAAGPGDPRRAQ